MQSLVRSFATARFVRPWQANARLISMQSSLATHHEHAHGHGHAAAAGAHDHDADHHHQEEDRSKVLKKIYGPLIERGIALGTIPGNNFNLKYAQLQEAALIQDTKRAEDELDPNEKWIVYFLMPVTGVISGSLIYLFLSDKDGKLRQ